MVVVTGPTGSGKSTTLYAAIQQLKEGTTNIITVEDPIEYRIPGITQIQVNQKVEMTFAKGLRSILRQDPDIIMVGEIRDLETAEVACQAAQTGHLVLSTLHTNTAPSAVVRLEDLGLEPFVVASSLGAVLAQRLVRRLCEACAKECSDDEKARISRKYGINAERTRTSVGCRECDLSGYRGRIGLYSLLVINEELRELIRKGASESKIEEAGLRHGMSTMEAEAKRLIASGVTTLEEIERVLGARERDLVEDDKQREISLADSETSVDTHMIELGELENIEDFRSLFSESNEDFVFDSGVNEITTPGIISAPSSQSIAGLAESFYVQEESTRKNTVLLVDDDEGVRVVLSRIFKNEGYVVHQAFDALDAFAKLQDCEPDLVVSDLVMPGFDGEEFVKRLRTNPKTVRTPVVMLTGSDSKEHEARARKAGVDEFLSKTLSPQIVLERVRMLLKK
jgi:CheY-like chemotaxis protein/nucleoside-triphosphatase THEP1